MHFMSDSPRGERITHRFFFRRYFEWNCIFRCKAIFSFSWVERIGNNWTRFSNVSTHQKKKKKHRTRRTEKIEEKKAAEEEAMSELYWTELEWNEMKKKKIIETNQCCWLGLLIVVYCQPYCLPHSIYEVCIGHVKCSAPAICMNNNEECFLYVHWTLFSFFLCHKTDTSFADHFWATCTENGVRCSLYYVIT